MSLPLLLGLLFTSAWLLVQQSREDNGKTARFNLAKICPHKPRAPIPHTRQIRNLSVIINIFYLLVSKIWAFRLKFQNVTKIGGFNPYYFTTRLLQLLCNWSLYFLSIPSQSILNVFPVGKKTV